MSEWKEYKFSYFVDINPTVKLKSGEVYSYMEMKDLIDGNKFCTSKDERKLTGGSRFIEKDTLFARITPCLENGKICQVKGLKEKIGFGSTEFLVFRGKENISDNEFVFYLSRWDEVRGFAEGHFEGTSGRQRVPRNCFDNLFLELPPLSEQRAIASILSSLDDKIDLLHRQNKTLEQLAETLFRQWFVVEAEESWEGDVIGNLISVVDNRGKTPAISQENTDYPLIEANSLNGESRLINYSVIKKYVSKETFQSWFRDKLRKYDILMTTVGANIGAIAMYIMERGNIAQNIIGLSSKKISPFYLYQTLKYKIDEIIQLDIGGVQPSIKVPHLLGMPIKIPPKELEGKFDNFLLPMINKMENNYLEILILEKLSDTLLPKLMSGELCLTLY